MTKIITTIGFSALLLFACGDKKEGGESSDKKGDPALAAEAQDVAKRFCECPDSACANEVKSASGKKPYDIFFKVSTSNLNKEEMEQWQAARSQWNECGKPGYKRPAAAADPAAADPAAADPAAADPAAADPAAADPAASDAAPAAE